MDIQTASKRLHDFYRSKKFIPDPLSSNFEDEMLEFQNFEALDVTERGGCHGHYADESRYDMEADYESEENDQE